MGNHYPLNGFLGYVYNPMIEKNMFVRTKAEDEPLPIFSEIKDKLPKPFWTGHEDTIRCYDKTWEIAFGNIKKANPEAGFISNFIDTAFNGYLFMWDSAFIVMFGKYASHIFNFQKTLDNFYSNQHVDGFICREIAEDPPRGGQWQKDNPASTGPNVLAWSEWEYFLTTGDKERLSKVFYPLLAYHKWLQDYRSWQDGTYWSCGFACGMDNQPRNPGYDKYYSHGFASWIDACAQMYLSGVILVKMAEILELEKEVDWLKKERDMLGRVINEKMWSEKEQFYFDTFRDGTLSDVKTIGSYWTLLCGLVPDNRLDGFIAHLENEKEFKRPNRIPTLSADHPMYTDDGAYWRGGVWAPTNYMVLRGLHRYKKDKLAFEIARDYLDNVTKVFNETETVFENYAPEYPGKGNPARRDFVGWTGLAPINCLFEYVFGIQADAMNKTIEWNINLTDEFGIKDYPLGDAILDLKCEKREKNTDKPIVHITSSKNVTVKVKWDGGEEIYIISK